MEVLEAREKMACSLYPWKGQVKTIKGSKHASARCDEQKDGKKPGVTGVQRGSCTDELTMIVRARTGLCQLKPEKISARRQVVTASPPCSQELLVTASGREQGLSNVLQGKSTYPRV